MNVSAEVLLDLAKSGQKLDVKERRVVVDHLMRTQPSMTNQEMANDLQVSESMIRVDKNILRKNMAQTLKDEDVGMVIADAVMVYNKQIHDLEVIKTTTASEAIKVKCAVMIAKLTEDKIRLLQSLGLYPENIAQMVISKYSFIAQVDPITSKVQSAIEGEIVRGEQQRLPEQGAEE